MRSILKREHINKSDAAFRRARVEYYTAQEAYHTMKKIYNDMRKKVKLNTSGIKLMADLHKKLIEDRSWYYECMANLNRVATSAFYRESYSDVKNFQTPKTLKYVLNLKKSQLDEFIGALMKERTKAADLDPDAVLRIELKNEVVQNG